jgi:filamentous hemagglutinin family protein
MQARSPLSRRPVDSLARRRARRLRLMSRRLTPVAIAVLLGAGALPARAQQAFSPAWFANKGAAQNQAAATGRLPSGAPASALSQSQAQQQKAREQLQLSVRNLGLAAQAIAAQQARQADARQQAGAQPATVPDGLGKGGLQVDTNSLTAGWLNAKAPTQQTADGRTTVTIAQTADRAILNWETFNVGRNTTVAFDQQAGWSVLNRVNDPLARPSEIQGRIKADGTVLIVNRNGIVFGGTSQVNTRNLVAAAVGLADAQFKKGLFSDAQGSAYVPTFANALSSTASSFSHAAATGQVVVAAGATIATSAPTSVTEGGGYVMLLGQTVRNDGSIATPSGQALLAAGDAFVVRPGMSTEANQTSSTRGNEVTPLRLPTPTGTGTGTGTTTPSITGQVTNTGLIRAETGDITLTGHDVRQDGTVAATTSVHTRGTVHLVADATDTTSRVRLGGDGVTAVLLDESATTALDVQRQALVKDSDKTVGDVPDRRDQSLVRIVSGGDVDFRGRSLTLATGGQILVDAVGTSRVADGALLDVAGAVGVRVAMEANNVLINVQGNEQRDAAGNRDDKSLNNSDIWLDRRDLVLVPAGKGYDTDRWYTAGGLLEVGGYLGITGHGIGEWSAQGGTVQFGGGALTTARGSSINLSGGTLDVQDGRVNQTFLKGADGRLYNASTAPGDLLYTGLYTGYETSHARWGAKASESFHNPLIAPSSRLENGYTVGRDAGRLVVATKAAVLQGDLASATFQGDRQQRARDDALDGYNQAQTAMAQGAQLIIGSDTPVWDKASGQLRHGPGAVASGIYIGEVKAGATPQAGRIDLDAAWLNAQKLGAFKAYATGELVVDQALTVATGGELALHATDTRINADLTARAGRISLGDMVVQKTDSGQVWQDKPIGGFSAGALPHQVLVGDGVTLDARGVWTNRQHDENRAGLAFVDGGTVSIRGTGNVTLGAGSLIDVSSGASLDVNDKLNGGRGGSVTLATGQYNGSGALLLDGKIRGSGVKGGGALNIENGTLVSIGGSLPDAVEHLPAGKTSELTLRLAADVTVKAGQVIPVSFSVTLTRVAGGQAFPITLRPEVSSSKPVTLAAPWVLPVTVQIQNGPVVYAGTTLPAGTVLQGISDLPAGYVLPAAAFPNGLSVPQQIFSYTAGSKTAKDLVVPRGTRLPPGTRWTQDVAVESFLAIDPALFRSGFGSYAVNGRDGLTVVPGTALDVVMPVLRLDREAGRLLASGEDPAGALTEWLPPLRLDDPAARTHTARAGASLSLSAGNVRGAGDLLVGEGARITVDPGKTLALTGNGQITIEGALTAHGGRISVLPGDLGEGNAANAPNGTPNARSLWIGDRAVLDASGQAYTATDGAGRRYGQVLNGGTIEVGGKFDIDARNADAIDAFLVVRPGARLEASGAQATLDLPEIGTTTLASHGGTIALSGANGLYVDGRLKADAGGAGALGGTLALRLETPVYLGVGRFDMLGTAVNDGVRVPRELVIEQTYGGSGLSTDAKAGETHATLAYGQARYGADAIRAGGFDTAALFVNGLLSFDGDVNLRLNQGLYLTASGVGLSAAAPRDSAVSLTAPYLRLSGSSRRQIDGSLMPNPVFGSRNAGAAAGTLGVPLVAEDARLTLAGQLVDVVGDVSMGARGEIIRNQDGPLKVERDAFGDLRLQSQGDLRLRDAGLYSPGHTTLAAAQVYGSGTVVVGAVSKLDQWGTLQRSFDPDVSLDIERVGTTLPAVPYSVFDTLSLEAGVINQGGVLRAPLGKLTLGAVSNGRTTQVNLLPGSVTSVSANGLTMPYGGTVDGLSYTYNGTDVVYNGVGFEPALVVRSDALDARTGAVIDLSGGGTLTGAAFLSGRGGSTDARLNPLVQRGEGRFVLPGLGTNPVYAVVPGVQPGYAPVGAEKGAGDPALGRQITIGAGVPGLPPGTYTLMPSTYALLPGAFRVELNGLAASPAAFGSTSPMRNGSWSTSARMGIANTGYSDTLPTQVIVTSGDTLRAYSQYNETSYSDFALQQAARAGAPRPLLERDGKALELALTAPLPVTAPTGSGGATGTAGGAGSATPTLPAGPALVMDATLLKTPGKDGNGIVARLTGASSYEILAAGGRRTDGFTGVSVNADELNAIGASRLEIGGTLNSTYSDWQTGSLARANVINVGGVNTRDITLRAGAELRAGEVYLMTGYVAGGIALEQGASINTLGQGKAAYDASTGYVHNPGRSGMLIVGNGRIQLLAPDAPDTDGHGAGAIEIGTCAAGATCVGETRLYSEGTIATATDNRFELGESVRYGTRQLSLALGGVNVGTSQALAEARARGALPAGLTFNQQVLDRLLLGDPGTGAPALESLSLTVRDAVNFLGDVTLSTYNPSTGASALRELVLVTPAIYGLGDADTTARIRTDRLVWTGTQLPAGAVAAGGPGTGSGRLVVDAREIVLGFGSQSQPDTVRQHDRLALGFSELALNASERITATHKGTLSVYQSQGAWDATRNAFAYSGGKLSIATPLLTGVAGSVSRITAGGDIRVTGGAGAAKPDNATLAGALGAELALNSRDGRLSLDTAVLLPSGKLTLAAQGDVTLADGAQLDLSGRRIDFFDTSKYSWGGDVTLDSRAGDVRQTAKASVDLSAENNRAGKLSAYAPQGTVALAGAFKGGASGHYDAGGTEVPYLAGRLEVQGRQIDDFTGLNDRLTKGGVTGARAFRIGQGDLTVGNELKAHEVTVALDNGHLTVAGTIDASGEQAGSIRLAAGQGVTLAAGSLLDASADVLRKDSYGQVIEAPNRATIEVDAGRGTLAIESGARLDLRVAGTPTHYGTVTLNAPRVGGNDVAIDARGPVTIDGARTVQVNAFITDKSAAVGTETTTDGKSYQVIDQAYLDRLHDQSEAFMNAALLNGALMDGKLAGLRAYRDAFHLRPGVEVVADTAVNPSGNLHVDGDIDLSRHRYASVNPHTTRVATSYGSGEAGALVVRAQGDLDVFGSLTDGFDTSRLPDTVDDRGWYLTSGRQFWGGDVVVPHSGHVTLAAGTTFVGGRTLNYDLPITGMLVAARTRLPVPAQLAQPLTVPKGTVLAGAVSDASGQVLYAAGTVLAQTVTLPANAWLGAGLELPAAASLRAMTWPAGVALPRTPTATTVTLARNLALDKGALIPGETNVVLPGGATTVDLRPRDANGNQGRNYAVAPMLAAGSQSWDVTLVAGADTQAADRLTVLRPAQGHGRLRFADTHYGDGAKVIEIPGTGSPAVYRWSPDVDVATWTDLGLADIVPGGQIDPAYLQMLKDWGYFSGSPTELNDWGLGPVFDELVPATPPDKALVNAPVREELFSVVRTGTGDLRLVSAGDIATRSVYGVYTAGTPSASLAQPGAADPFNQARSVDTGLGNTVLGPSGASMEPLVNGGARSLYQAWYPEHGGNLLLRAGGDISGDTQGRAVGVIREEPLGYATNRLSASSAVGNWLWRQGTGSVGASEGEAAVPAAWWINFGTYAPSTTDSYYSKFALMPRLTGFTGFGTLGGGNLLMEAGANAGMVQARGDDGSYYNVRSTGLNLAVASTGRVTATGELVQTGGGDLDIRIGGGLNADPALRAFTGTNIVAPANTVVSGNAHRLELNGTVTALRGALRMETGSIGGVELRYGGSDPTDTRASNVFESRGAVSSGGPVLVLGDATAHLDARGDLVLGSVVDAGRVPLRSNGTPFQANGAAFTGNGFSWFSLWTPSTAVDLLAAGGQLTPTLAPLDLTMGLDAQPTDINILYPSVFRAAAASGSIYYGKSTGASKGVSLAPSPVDKAFAVSGTGQLELLAAGSLYAAGSLFSMSGADPTLLVNPFNPGFVGAGDALWYGRRMIHNFNADASGSSALFSVGNEGILGSAQNYPMFSLTPPTASGHVYVGQEPARYYAVSGDVVGLRTGSVIYRGFSNGSVGKLAPWYDGGGAVAVRAGRDITDAGTPLGKFESLSDYYGSLGWTTTPNRADLSAPAKPVPSEQGSTTGNLIVHTSADDVSVLEAGRDVRHANFRIAGPGLLDVSAGRDVYMADKASLHSLGPVANVKPGDRSSGASISVSAGLGEAGADWAAFAARYLDPANQADTGRPFADQPGKALRIYSGATTLGQWLRQQFGYAGDEAGATAFLATKQAELDKIRAAALAAGGSAASRDLSREYKLEAQLNLVNWLDGRFGGANGRGLHFDAAKMDARAFFAKLPIEQQRAFLRGVYYAELRASGREYNQAGGPREGSYLRGREAIATLLPEKDAKGQAIVRQGDLTMFSSALYYDQFVNGTITRRPKPGYTYIREDEWIAMGSPGYDTPFYKVNDAGIHTDFGGSISLMVPGGRALVGVDGGFKPDAGSGVLTQGEGDISVYAKGSLLLGQSRIFTTFGGNILAWSAEGDINAGRGSKTTVVYTPARRVYDAMGNVALSPNTPNTGAGIATLNPIPEVPPGDVDLIAPLGTIDAGEAGIRVSGNVNLAALHVVNAENIKVQGEAIGIPVVASVNIGALTNASTAASQATVAAQDLMQRERAAQRQAQPSIVNVKVLGFGGESAETPAPAPRGATTSQAPRATVEVVGDGTLTAEQRAKLTEAERRNLRP